MEECLVHFSMSVFADAMDSTTLTMTRRLFMWKELLHRHLQSFRKPLIVVLGPTASGKTAFSVQLAKFLQTTCKGVAMLRGAGACTEPVECGAPQHDKWKAEIVNADSRQLYRYLDIGTAKVSTEEMRGVPHHLLSVLDPKEGVTIAWYKEQATRTIHEVLARGNVPILVGGSMLYLSSIIDGLEPLPPVDPELRRRLSEEYERDRGKTLYRRLQELDPDSAVSIHPHNKVYLIRALEVFEGTGKPASVQRQKSGCPYDLLIFGMQWPREELVSRINERTRELFKHGWVEEVKGLLQRGYAAEDPGMESQGYREIAFTLCHPERSRRVRSPALMVRGSFGAPHHDNAGHLERRNLKFEIERVRQDEELVEHIAAKARQYAKRQMTWWRNDERIYWIDSACHPEVRAA